jgi:Glycosyl hydrolase family 79 C-terminal beta domain
VAVLALVLVLAGGASASARGLGRASVVVGGPQPVRPVGAGFVGLSMEYDALVPYAGDGPDAINPVFVQLLRNLSPGSPPVIRLGGDSADWAWVPTPGVSPSPGIRIALTPTILKVAGALARDVPARMIPDLNLEANDPRLAAQEARALVGAIGSDHVRALEIGNEPELYGRGTWYRLGTVRVLGRRRGYSLADYAQEFTRTAQALPSVPLAGPASGNAAWAGDLTGFAGAVPRLSLVTVHRYPLQRCSREPGTPGYPTVARLLSARSTAGLAASVASEVTAAHAHGVPIRVDELNSVACRGAPGVSDTFVSALWALDALFELARVGVDGVNIHTLLSASYGLFTMERAGGDWRALVSPDYYGLLAFVDAAPAGSHLLSTISTAQAGTRVWATRTPAGRTHVVLINTASSRGTTVAVHLPTSRGAGRVSYLRAASLRASGGVSLGGQTFGRATASGRPSAPTPPRTVARRRGAYVVRVPAASAAMLTVSARR